MLQEKRMKVPGVAVIVTAFALCGTVQAAKVTTFAALGLYSILMEPSYGRSRLALGKLRGIS